MTLFLTQQNEKFNIPDKYKNSNQNTLLNFDINLYNNSITPLLDVGLILLSGKDAVNFIHNQVTNNILKLNFTNVKLAGYCNAKGRLLATFLIWKDDVDNVILQIPYSLQLITQKRLQMFIVRAKVKITDITFQYIALGLFGSTIISVLQKWFQILPVKIYDIIHHDHGILMRLADSCHKPRYQWLVPIKLAIKILPTLKKMSAFTDITVWHLTDIYAGILTINRITQGKFIPQMINFELIGGVDFKKGCYPGQEIIARTQYLGKIKRRTILALVNTNNVYSGMEIFSSEDTNQPCGIVANAEMITPNHWVCLIVIQLTVIKNCIYLNTSHGPILQPLCLPYTLPEFIIN